MDLEQISMWLSLAQQPYPVISEFLQQISAESVDNKTTELLNQFLQKHHCQIDHDQLDKALTWLQQPSHQLLPFTHYPEQLKAINSPPPVLFLSGDATLLSSPQLAIVGSRKPTGGGRENVNYFSAELTTAGLTIVSGLATGIDGLAHQAALDADGSTIAILGCGHNTCYPKQHLQLLNSIDANGLIISEFTPDTPVRAHQFPRRNRIISGLCLGVLVVEAAIKSGSLITCRLAAEQGREVFAIPGDITNPLSRGGHHLIRNGACLVETPEHILEILSFSNTQLDQPDAVGAFCRNKQEPELNSDEKLLLQSIDRHPTSIDCLVNRSGMQMSLVLSVLFSLELKRIVIGSADGYFKNLRYR